MRVVAFAVATRDKDAAGQQKARADLERFAAALGTGLRTLARGKVDAAAASKALDQHDAHLLDAITAYAAADYRKAHDVSYAGFQHMFPIAATLARAVEGHVGARLPVGGAATARRDRPAASMTRTVALVVALGVVGVAGAGCASDTSGTAVGPPRPLISVVTSGVGATVPLDPDRDRRRRSRPGCGSRASAWTARSSASAEPATERSRCRATGTAAAGTRRGRVRGSAGRPCSSGTSTRPRTGGLRAAADAAPG
jgi:hypothetical protein